VKNPSKLLLALAGLAAVITPPADAGITVFDGEDVTMELGLRLQPRIVVARGVEAFGGGPEWQRDFLVRRSRIKIGGKVYGVSYGLEWRLDGTGLNAGIAAPPPISGLENGWIQWPITGPELQVKAGLYDQPFSRDRLTSDSKQMVVDRSLVSGVPNALGMADNAIGVDLRGKIDGGRYTYVAGVYDNRTIWSALQNKMPMLVGRIDFNYGETGNVYRDAHFGDGSWYCLGVNGSYQSGLKAYVDEDDPSQGLAGDDGKNAAFGVDGMVDFPAGPGRLMGRAEFNTISIEAPGSGTSVTTNVWMVGGGYLVWEQRLQPTIRFDQIIADDKEGGAKTNATFVGLNWYERGHNLKVQADVAFVSGTGDSFDGGRAQVQLDF